jgi:cell division protein FtsQ
MDIAEQENIPLPGELDSEDESPYLRRQKAVAVRRKRVSRRLRWVLFSVFVVLPVGLAGYLLATFALSSPQFLLTSEEDVVVSGNRFVSREEILNVLGLPVSSRSGMGINIFRLSLGEKRKQVESIPWVQSATVTRAFPHRLAVRVVERAPVAFVNIDGRLKLVDGDGILLDRPEKANFDFPLLTGLASAGNPEERKARLGLYQDFSRDLAEEVSRSGWLVSEVDLSDADDLKALMVQGHETIQVHFGHKEFRERFHNFLALLPEVRKSNTPIDSVDLRYRNQIVVNPAGAAPQSSPGAASPEALRSQKD